MREYLKRWVLLEYEFIVAEQDDSDLFNRGLLLNCGFIQAREQGCNRVCFHDIDLLPLDSQYYSIFPEEPLELVKNIEGSKEPIPYNYFGGVTLVSNADFERVNGYSNRYEGWGFEDDDFLVRCHLKQVGKAYARYDVPGTGGSAVLFDGTTQVSKKFKLRKGSFLLLVDFVPEYPEEGVGYRDMDLVSLKDPESGTETRISYDKFSSYRAVVWDKSYNNFSITTGKAPLLHSRCLLYLDADRQTYSFYWNGKRVGKYRVRGNAVLPDSPKVPKEFEITIGNNFKGKLLEAACVTFREELTEEQLQRLSLEAVDLQEHFDVSSYFQYSGSDADETTAVWYPKDINSRGFVKIPLQVEKGTFRSLGHSRNLVVDGHYLPEICRNQDLYYRVCRDNSICMGEGLNTVRKFWNLEVSKPEPDVTWVKVRKK